MKRWIWLVALVPAALGGLFAIYWAFLSASNPIAYLRIDLASLSLVLGLGVSGLAAAVVALQSAWERRRQKMSMNAADERRRFLRRLDHELKNPLTAIRAGLANLSDSPADKAHDSALASVEAQTVRLSRL